MYLGGVLLRGARPQTFLPPFIAMRPSCLRRRAGTSVRRIAICSNAPEHLSKREAGMNKKSESSSVRSAHGASEPRFARFARCRRDARGRADSFRFPALSVRHRTTRSRSGRSRKSQRPMAPPTTTSATRSPSPARPPWSAHRTRESTGAAWPMFRYWTRASGRCSRSSVPTTAPHSTDSDSRRRCRVTRS